MFELASRVEDKNQRSRVTIPGSVAEFEDWAQTTLHVEFGESARRHFELNSSRALLTVQRHPFFLGLSARLASFNDSCRVRNGFDVLMSSPEVQLHQKSFAAVVNKAFRLNVVWNRQFPNPPKGGWVTPDQVPDKLDDLIRGTIVTKYVDQPQLLAEHLTAYATSLDLASNYTSRGQDDGYYAYHFYVELPVEWVDRDFRERRVNLNVELQLTTQLQEILYAITHDFYEQRRVLRAEDPHSWKWEFKANRFRAGYLSHTLHLLEAIIVDLRDTRRPPEPGQAE